MRAGTIAAQQHELRRQQTGGWQCCSLAAGSLPAHNGALVACKLVHSWHSGLHTGGGTRWVRGTQLAFSKHVEAVSGGFGGRNMARQPEVHRWVSLVRHGGGLHGAGAVAREQAHNSTHAEA